MTEPHHSTLDIAAASTVLMAFKLANQAVIADIESEACKVCQAGVTWWDVRPMLDPREHSGEVIDMAGLAIAYALQSGLAVRHPEQDHLVRITHQA